MPQDSFDVSIGYLNGRRIAGNLFLDASALNLHANETCVVVCPDEHSHSLLRESWIGDPESLVIHSHLNHSVLAACGCLHLADPSLVRHAKERPPYREADYSISSIIHTLSSRSAIDAIADCVASDVYPWDALICTSTAGRTVVHQIWEHRCRYLADRFGASSMSDDWMPQTPLIPLPGPAHQPYHPNLSRTERRLRSRSELGIPEDAFVICTVGRLSFSSKSHPAILYRSIEMLAEAGQPVVLVECGCYPSVEVKQAYEHLLETFPRVHRVLVGGDQPASDRDKWGVYAAADVFVSLSDSIQETFGLTILEAMLAELPVLASDWDGYRDLVVHNLTGLLIPTTDLLPTLTQDPMQVGFYSGQLDYDRWVGIASLGVIPDQQALLAALVSLIENPGLAQSFATSGLQRYQDSFSPSSVIARYRNLWNELSSVRQRALSRPLCRTGRAPEMGRLFSHYATTSHSIQNIVIIDQERLAPLLVNGLGPWFYDLIFAGRHETCQQFLRSSSIVSQTQLISLGYHADQAQRILTVLLKFGLARLPSPEEQEQNSSTTS